MNKTLTGIIILGAVAGLAFFVSRNKEVPLPSVAPITEDSSPQSNSAVQENIITLTSDNYSPNFLTIKIGDKVTWVNKSGTDATVHSSPHPSHTDYPPLNLGIFSDGEMLSLTFSEKGTYKYHNHLNPGRSGSIIVQ